MIFVTDGNGSSAVNNQTASGGAWQKGGWNKVHMLRHGHRIPVRDSG